MKADTQSECRVIDLEHHPRTWIDPGRVRAYLSGKRLDRDTLEACVRFAEALPAFGETLPRTWAPSLVASLPKVPSERDLEISVNAAVWYFRYLVHCGGLRRLDAQVAEYDLLADAHVAEELVWAKLDRPAMLRHLGNGVAQRVEEYDRRVAAHGAPGIDGRVSWLGGWTLCRGHHVVMWVPAGGGRPVAEAVVDAGERGQALTALYVRAFMEASKRGKAPARIAVFTVAQERAMRDFAEEADTSSFPLYRLHENGPLRFFAQELVLG